MINPINCKHSQAHWTYQHDGGYNSKYHLDCFACGATLQIVSEKERNKMFYAPNADHIDEGLIQRHALYRHIERMAGMTVPQWDRDCMGEPFLREPLTAKEVYAHVLKAIAEFPDDSQLFRNSVLEEAAKVADDYRKREYSSRGAAWVPCDDVVAVATEIRNLKEDVD